MTIRILLPFALALLPMRDLLGQEVCTNGIDDDADGLVDLNDSLDCACDAGFVPLSGIIPNPGFEELNCCPSSYSMMYCATGWVQATSATSDFFHQCDYFPDWIQLPLPDGGQGCVGGYQTTGYQEYIGGCLESPLLAGQTYVLHVAVAAFLANNFSLTTTLPIDFGPLDLTIYGSTVCGTLPLPTITCPDPNGFDVLGTAVYNPAESWQWVSFIFTPTVDVMSWIIGGPCVLPASYGSSSDPDSYYPYLVYDAFSIGEAGSNSFPLATLGDLCTDDLLFIATPLSGDSGQWYLDGVALAGQTDSILPVSALGLGAGAYQFNIATDSTCLASYIQVDPPVYPVASIVVNQTGLICPVDGTYQWFLDGQLIAGATGNLYVPVVNGVYTVQVTNENGCSSLSDPVAVTNVGIATVPGYSAASIVHRIGDDALSVVRAPGSFRFALFDATGAQVVSTMGSGPTWRYVLGDLPSGMYIARVGYMAVRFIH